MTDIPISDLSDREQEILKLLATGASNKEIAQQLVISSNTVRVHMRNIFEKIHVGSRTEAALYAVRCGLVDASGFVSESNELAAGTKDVVAVEPVQPVAHEPALRGEVLAPQAARPAFLRFWWVGVALLAALFLWLSIPAIRNSFATPLTPTPTETANVTWIDLTEMQAARRGLAAVALEDQIFAIAGEGTNGITGAVESYSIATNTWEMLASKPTPVTDVAAAVLGGLIYIPGGMTSSGSPTSVLEVYNPANDTWETRSPLPVALSAYGLEAFEGRLYVFGGNDGTAATAAVYSYNPTTDEWAQAAPMSVAREYLVAVTSSSRIYVMGGRNETGALTTCEYYHPSRDIAGQNPWSRCSSLPQPMYRMGAAVVADIIILIGGVGDNDLSISYQFVPQTGVWQQVSLANYPDWISPRLIPLGSHLFLVGGELDGNVTAKASYYQMTFRIVLPIFR